MQYKKLMHFDKYRITEVYEVDGVSYPAELEIFHPGVYAGMGGKESHAVQVVLMDRDTGTELGSVHISFPSSSWKKSSEPQRMVETLPGPTPDCSGISSLELDDYCPPQKKFTPYACAQIQKAVEDFIRLRTRWAAEHDTSIDSLGITIPRIPVPSGKIL